MTRRGPVVLLVLLAACGGSGRGPLASAEEGLGKVKRGVLDLRLTGGAGEQASSDDEDVGFSLEGPFDLSGQKGELPKAELTFDRFGVDGRPATFISNGSKAWVRSGSRTTELTGSQLDAIRLTEAGDGVAGLDLADWSTSDGKRSDGGTVDGVAVEKVEADVDPVKALNDVFTLAGQFGSGVGQIESDAADRVRKAAKSSKVVVLQGDKDGLVRRLTLDVVFKIDAADALRSALGELTAARLHLDLKIEKPNQPIEEIDEP